MNTDLLVRALADIQTLRNCTLREWDILIRQARSADLTARLALLAEAAGLLPQIPPAPRAHLHAARIQAEAQALAVRREVRQVQQALAPLQLDWVLLKGAAYLMGALPAAKGRRFADLDILVPKERLAEVEATLMLHGWAGTHHAPYDQHYYRQWMHELPPMLHIRRMTVLDVHHAIVPTTADLKPATPLLLAASVTAAPGLKMLAPADMVLHSATHLFYNEEFSHGLRDMSDLDLLLRHFSQQADFWDVLLQRAHLLHLSRPLYYCLRYCVQLFATPVPAAVIEAVRPAAPWRTLARGMDSLWLRVLHSQHPSAGHPRSGLAAWLLYVRAHWHKMPPWLLLYHLCAKSLHGKKPTWR